MMWVVGGRFGYEVEGMKLHRLLFWHRGAEFLSGPLNEEGAK
jgi:hypothetical protein